jgi:hypothetical protein
MRIALSEDECHVGSNLRATEQRGHSDPSKTPLFQVETNVMQNPQCCNDIKFRSPSRRS